MNWTMVGALGEFLGAAGVILTLLYLARQVREARIAVRQEAERELIDENSAMLGWIAESPQRSNLWVRGMADDPSLSAEELVQFRAFLLRFVLLWQRTEHLDQTFTIEDPWFAEQSRAIRDELIGAPGFKSWMSARGDWLTPEFREYLELQMERSPGYTPPDRHKEGERS